jgi:hypothetical protein
LDPLLSFVLPNSPSPPGNLFLSNNYEFEMHDIVLSWKIKHSSLRKDLESTTWVMGKSNEK